MKRIASLMSAALLAGWVMAGAAYGQQTPDPARDQAQDRDQVRDQVRDQTGPVVTPPLPPERPSPPAGREVRPERPERPARPERPEPPALPDAIKALMEKFNTAREEFLAEQKKLMEQLASATEAERAAIREQIQANREEFLAATKALREEIRTQMQNMREQLPNRKDVIDQAGPRPGSRPGVN